MHTLNSIINDLNASTYKQKIPFIGLLFLFSFLSSSIIYGQYVHPNQPGRAGGDTGPGIGDQVVTSTYIGNTGNLAGQGTIMSVEKDGTLPAAFHDFDGYPNDGSFPWYTTPHQASDGKLYGTSYLGGSNKLGTVYTYDFDNCGESIVYDYDLGTIGGSNGNYANINELSDGKLYYVSSYGGLTASGQLLSMNKDGSNVTLLHNFTPAAIVPYTAAADAQTNSIPNYEGLYPYGFVVEGADGKIYGSTFAGGAYGIGTIYRMDKDGSNYEIIHVGDSNYRYSYKDGAGNTISGGSTGMYTFWGNVAQGQDGRIYFVGYSGGQTGAGGLSSIEPDGSDIRILVSGSAANGTNPYRGPIVINDEVFGTFRVNGGGSSVGVVWRYNITTATYTKIKQFDVGNVYEDGTDPWAGLTYDGTFLYGTTLTNGGPGIVGTIYKIKPDGSDFETIHRFSKIAATTCNGAPVAFGDGLYSYFPSAERVTFANVDYTCSEVCVEGYEDTDGDGVPDSQDSDPSDPCAPAQVAGYTNYIASNPIWAAADCDGDGETNGAEEAANTDPYDPCSNSYNSATLCAYVTANPASALAAADCDAGGISNAIECANGGDPLDASDDATDSDGDGISDEQEALDGTDPTDPCSNSYDSAALCAFVAANPTSVLASADCDGGGISNASECANGGDPLDASDDATDSDGDGISDEQEALDGTDPTDPCSNSYDAAALCAYVTANPASPLATADCDAGGVDNATECANGGDPLDALDDDSDGDGISDEQEALDGTDPTDPCSNSYDAAALCAFVTANPASPLATADCDAGGVNNVTECATGGDPLDASDDLGPACNAGSVAPILIRN